MEAILISLAGIAIGAVPAFLAGFVMGERSERRKYARPVGGV